MLGDSVIADLPKYARTVGSQNWNPAFDCVRQDTVADAHKNGLTVNTWTVNDKEGWNKARVLKVDTIITDDPVGLKAYLAGTK
jgi:glycerophosphoryl diester phosphodiesterase